MTDDENTQNTTSRPPVERWLRLADRLVAARFEQAFAAEGVTRGEWRVLTALDEGAPVAPAFPARAARGGALRGLVARGWVADIDGAWALTDAGRAAKERLDGVADGIRAQLAEAADLDSVGAALERIARGLGGEDPLSGSGPAFGADEGFGGRGRRGGLDRGAEQGGFSRGARRGGRGRGGRGTSPVDAPEAGFRGGRGRAFAGFGRGAAGDGPASPAFRPCPPEPFAGRGGHRGRHGGRGFGPYGQAR